MDSRAPSVFRCQSTLATLNLGTCTQQDVFYLVQAPWKWTSQPWNFSDTQWSCVSSPVLQRGSEGLWTIHSPPSVSSENTAWKLTLTTSCLTHDPVPVLWVAATDCWGRRCSWRPVKPVSDLLAGERPVDCCPDSIFVVFAHFATLIFQLSFVVRTLPRNHLKFKIRRKKSECDNKTSSGTATNFSGTRQLLHQSTPETSGVSIKVLQCSSDGLCSVSSPWPLKSII